MELSFLTHAEVQAGFVAYAGALLISRVVNHPIRNMSEGQELLEWVTDSVVRLEQKYKQHGWQSDWEDTISSRLRLIPSLSYSILIYIFGDNFANMLVCLSN